MPEILKNHADKFRFLIVGSTNTALDFGILFEPNNLLKYSKRVLLIFISTSLPFCSHFLQIKNILSSQHLKT